MAATTAAVTLAAGSRSSPAAATTPTINHVVFILQENHSFDNVLGLWCVQTHRCDGATSGTVKTGETIPLSQARDKVVNVIHTGSAQEKAIDHGKMNGFSLLEGCGANGGYLCYSQYNPTQIPNLLSIAANFAVSDRTFETDVVQSWGAHLDVVAATLDGTTGELPSGGISRPSSPGWGCDSGKDIGWNPGNGQPNIRVPACIPKPDGSGPYRPSPVLWVPTIMDRLDAAGLSWKLYTGPKGINNSTGYGWAMCPAFSDCLYTNQHHNMVANSQVITDARAGALPAFSIVTPNQTNSQHNRDSMAVGDNWIGQVFDALQNSPEWASTAVFISYDDCGCFYDHVPPPAGLGIREPMIIAGGTARPGFTDSSVASFVSVLAFTETVFGLPSLGAQDAGAYNYMNAFNLAALNHVKAKITTTRVPAAELRDISANPPDPQDPT